MHIHEIVIYLDGGRTVRYNPHAGFRLDGGAVLHGQELKFLTELSGLCGGYKNHFSKEPTDAGDKDQDEAPPTVDRTQWGWAPGGSHK
jgi:hypothetical protein